MLISESWLREFVSPQLDTAALAARLTLAGLEVASVAPVTAPVSSKLVVGQVVALSPHPEADKLTCCRVDVGRKRKLTIVCGAPNVAVGIKVPVALPGCTLGERHITARTLRNVVSHGMLCSAAELGLQEHSHGLMLLDASAPLGETLRDYLQLDDSLLTLELTPNRGDCLSHLGVAREVAALTSSALKSRRAARPKVTHKTRLAVRLEAPSACPRYVGRAVCGIQMDARTPDWMAERLRRCGLRSINPVVDITNYVMLETGQPLHAFDLDKIDGEIIVRMAKPKESLKLLDGTTLELTEQHLVIADRRQAIALGGIMGGDNSAISATTHNIYFEAAFFHAAALVGKARQLGLHTDAGYRFERGVDAYGQLAAVERATELVLQIAGGAAAPVTHTVVAKALPKNKPLRLKKSDITRTLGVDYPAAKVTALFKRLGMQVTPSTAAWQVVAPSWRFDLRGAHDLVEEVGRSFGFEHIPSNIPRVQSRPAKHPETHVDAQQLKARLVAAGFCEAISYSFVDPQRQSALLEQTDAIALANPIADNMSVMRQSLWPGLLEALTTNLNRQHEQVRLFEVGRVFFHAGRCAPRQSSVTRPEVKLEYCEIEKLAGIMSGAARPRQWAGPTRSIDFFDLKGVVAQLLEHLTEPVAFVAHAHPALHPGQAAALRLGHKVIGHIGKLHPAKQHALDIAPAVYLFELNLAPLQTRARAAFTDISRYPSVQRDLAVVVNRAITTQEILDTVRQNAGELLVALELFDIYRGEILGPNQRSFAFSLTFQSTTGNLTATQVEQYIDTIVAALQSQYAATLR